MELERVPAQERGPLIEHRRYQPIEESVNGFLDFLRAYAPGWHLTEHIVEFFDWYAEEQRIELPRGDELRAVLGRCQGVRIERRRVKGLTGEAFRHVRRFAKHEKAKLYYIASVEELEAAARAEVDRPAPAKGKAKARGKAAPRAKKPGMGDLFLEAAA